MPLTQALRQAPLPAETADALARITGSLDIAGLWWLSGYAAGLATRTDAPGIVASATPKADSNTAARLTVVYGSQTGNARRAAEQLAADAEAAGLSVRLLRADAYPPRELKTERMLYLVASTQGEGEPSDDIRDLIAYLTSKRAPQLAQLHFAVLGLGDSSYPQFCEIGRLLDTRLADLGGQRLLPRGDADLDIDTVAVPWRQHAVTIAQETLKPSATVTPLRPSTAAAAVSAFSREQPFNAEVLVNQRITMGDKDVRHIELSLEGSGLQYSPGDALGVWPRNPSALVDAVLAVLQLDGATNVTHDGDSRALQEWLRDQRELTRLAPPFLLAHAERAGSAALDALLQPGNSAFTSWIADRQVLDVLREFPAPWRADALVAALRPRLPRLYSIASSQTRVGDEVHLTVAHVERAAATHHGEEQLPRWGVASHLLASRVEGDRVRVYVQPNERFRLPTDASRDVIMIGPGTGVAPFRAFVQQRSEATASGRSWLLFGNPRFRSDFLYQLEWQRALKDGALDRLDLAFSRDQPEKIYVQDRIREHGRDIAAWLKGGAHLYVCGGIAMGKDVHAALLDVVADDNDGDRGAAGEFIAQLQRDGRYARDVY